MVRVWTEGSSGHQFKGRIAYSLDLSRPEQTGLVVGDPEAVKAALKTWLDGFISEIPR